MDKSTVVNAVYYQLKPLIPRTIQIWMRSKVILKKREGVKDVWPILATSAKAPEGWKGWPEHKQFGVVLTHDVEWSGGQDKVFDLAKIEKELGFRSSFNFVPERYEVSAEVRKALEKDGFEVSVHGLNHDGKLFQSRKIFRERAPKINHYIKDWDVVGFRSPAMHHNLEWIKELNVDYDLSTFDTDPFEPQADGVETIYPFWVSRGNGGGYVEMPYTLAQDFTLFMLMKEKTIDIWKKKVDWIADKGGMALVNTHPDYMSFNGKKPGLEEYPAEYYAELLNYIQTKYEGKYWHALPKDVCAYVKTIFQTILTEA